MRFAFTVAVQHTGESPMRLFASFAFVAIVVASPAFAGAPSVAGNWSGQMRQIDPSKETSYPMTLTLSGKKGTTSYPTLKCGGTLARVAEAKGGYTIYKETVTNESGGGCIDGVLIVQPDAGNLILGWFAGFEGEPSLASAVLAKAAK